MSLTFLVFDLLRAPAIWSLNGDSGLSRHLLDLGLGDEQLQNAVLILGPLRATENRITVARKEFNEATQAYNIAIRKFPANLIAMIFSFKQKPYFASDEGASQAPKVEF